MTGIRAIATHRATHPYGRSLLRVSALCVGITIAACSPRHDWKADEIPARTYADIADQLPDYDAHERQMVRNFMADGKIDYRELEEINDYDAAQRDRAVNVARIKSDLAQSQTPHGDS
jgi:hypothetical protein